MSEDVSKIRARGQERIHDFNQLAFIPEDALANFIHSFDARCPGSNANYIAATVATCFSGAGKMDQVPAPARGRIELA